VELSGSIRSDYRVDDEFEPSCSLIFSKSFTTYRGSACWAHYPFYDPALLALRTWFDSWRGVGHVAVGMPTRALISG
jgi:hypothetical protein